MGDIITERNEEKKRGVGKTRGRRDSDAKCVKDGGRFSLCGGSMQLLHTLISMGQLSTDPSHPRSQGLRLSIQEIISLTVTFCA
jgi:hypothetical protein